MENPGFLSVRDIQTVYLPLGFSNFKLEGRGLGSAMILKTAPNMDNAKAFQRVKKVRSRSISFCFVGVDDSVRPADCS